eukprot:scaffold7266_cov403-Prasinococcus_capsulatus_cf.AAC.4
MTLRTAQPTRCVRWRAILNALTSSRWFIKSPSVGAGGKVCAPKMLGGAPRRGLPPSTWRCSAGVRGRRWD